MIVIRRLVDRQRAYTGIFLPGEPAQIFPTTDFEHGRILQIYKQDKAYSGVVNDFSDDSPLAPSPVPATSAKTKVTAKKAPVAPAPASANAGQKKQPRSQHSQARQKRRP